MSCCCVNRLLRGLCSVIYLFFFLSQTHTQHFRVVNMLLLLFCLYDDEVYDNDDMNFSRAGVSI